MTSNETDINQDFVQILIDKYLIIWSATEASFGLRL